MGDSVASTSGSILKSAEDVARRANTQILIVGSGLALSLFPLIEGARFVSAQREILRIDDARENAFHIQERAAANRIKLVRQGKEKAESDFRVLGCARATEIVRPRCGKPSRIIRQNALAEERLREIQKELERSKKEIAPKQKRLIEKFSETVSFNVGGGLKLPFSLDVAPIVWLTISLGLFVFAGMKRSQFWRLAVSALVRRGDDRSEQLGLVAPPIWIAPVPRGRDKAGVTRWQLARLVDWGKSYRLQHKLLATVALALGAIALWVAWIGLSTLDLFQRMESLSRRYGAVVAAPQPFDMRPLVMALLVCNLVALLCFLIPGRATSALAVPVYGVGDRRLVLRALTGGAVLCISSVTASPFVLEKLWSHLREKAGMRWNHFRPRRRLFAQLGKVGLKPGWYRNIRTGVVHYLPVTGRVRWVKTIVLANIVPHEMVEMFQEGQPSGRRSRPPRVSHRKLEFDEDRAIALVSVQRYQDAFGVLYNDIVRALQGSWFAQPVPILRRIDLAAGLAIRYDLQIHLDELVSVVNRAAAALPEDHMLRPALAGRVSQWTSPSGEKWRNNRWRCQPHPLRWNGHVFRV
jgi:hypothetical protein